MSRTDRSRPPEKAPAVVRSLPTGRDEVVIESLLPGVHAEDVWFHASTERGINDELFPLLRMCAPRGSTWARLTDAPVGEPAGRCWILLGRIVPIDYDDLFLDQVGPGMQFRERSRTSTCRLWGHERSIDQTDAGAVVHDRVLFEVLPRLTWMRPALRVVVAGLFRYRHRRLRRVIGPWLSDSQRPHSRRHTT